MNLYGISSCGILLALCAVIPLLSEFEEQVRDFIITRFLGPLAAPCPEEEANYERY